MRLVPVLFLVLACSGGEPEDSTSTLLVGAPSGTPGGATTSTTVTAPTHDADIQPIWDESCGNTCHINDDDGNLSLSDAYDKIVGVPSDDLPSMNLVEPGDPDASYLWRKIDNTHLEVGGDGAEMPRGFLTIGKKKRERVEQWILDGAPR